ncbi:MAG: sulfite exporter TauE/SafE family protein [Gemmatimonadetes bacterium]|nr:sulfite exporter TauE/SafE family protein [Gemmatimonadota bacterium]
MMIAALTGLLAGCIHVLTGPDHLTAIAPLAVRRPRAAWVPGVRWGLGHTSGVFVVGMLALWLRDRLPVDLLSSWGDRAVGVVLFGIGIWALRRALQHNVHAHVHEHDGERHVHLHVHAHQAHHEEPFAHAGHTHAAFAIGTLHGLAGSSHVLGILPMLALPTRVQAITYLVSFGVGTIFAMAVFSSGMGWLTTRYAANSVKIYRGLMSTCAVAAMVIGCVWFTGWSW